MSNWLLGNILTLLVASLIVGIMIPQIIVIAFRKHLFDVQDERKIHKGTIPRLGGISFVPGIIFSVLFTLGLGLKFGEVEIAETIENGLIPFFFLCCSLMLLFLVGIADDIVSVRYRDKFIFQIIASVLTLISGVCVRDFHGFFWMWDLPFLPACLITAFLIVYIINSYNLIDGIDGLAAGLATIALTYFGIAYYDAHAYLYSMISFGGVGVLIPFLYFNLFGRVKHGKKIFMGDTGSLTIGMLIAFLAVEFTEVTEYENIFAGINPVTVAFSPLMIPMFDQLRVFFHRVVRHRNPFLPDRCHIHHKLLALGFGNTQTLGCILSAALLFIVLNWLMARVWNVTVVIVMDLLIWTLANILLTSLIRRKERRIGEKIYD